MRTLLHLVQPQGRVPAELISPAMASRTRTFDPAGVVFGVVLPIAAAAVGVVLTSLWRSRLPEQIATHWSGTEPDGFTNPTTSAWTLAIITVLVGGGCSAVASLAHALLVMRRTMLLIGSTVVGLITVLQVAVIVTQLDRAEVANVTLPGWALAVGTAVGFIVGLIGASLLRDYRERAPATEPPPAELPREEAALPIVEQLGAGRTAVITLLVIMIGASALSCVVSDSLWPLAIFVPLTILPLSLLRFSLHIDADTLYISSLGMAAFDYGIDEITGASVRDVDPVEDFGGWGLRSKGRGNYAVATRKGTAAFVTFANGQRLTITTDRAQEIAGALNTLADSR